MLLDKGKGIPVTVAHVFDTFKKDFLTANQVIREGAKYGQQGFEIALKNLKAFIASYEIEVTKLQAIRSSYRPLYIKRR